MDAWAPSRRASAAFPRGARQAGHARGQRHRQADLHVPQSPGTDDGDLGARPHAEGAQRFPDSDSGAERRGCGGRVETWGQVVDEGVSTTSSRAHSPWVVEPSCRSEPHTRSG